MDISDKKRAVLRVYTGILSGKVEEKHVQVKSFVLVDAQGERTMVLGEESNCFERYFVQCLAKTIEPRFNISDFYMTPEREAYAAVFFGDTWEDRHLDEGRPLLVAIGNAAWIEQIEWES